MKNLKCLLVWVLSMAILLGMTSAVFAQEESVIIDVNDKCYSEVGIWVDPKTTKDYQDIPGTEENSIQRAAENGNPKVKFELGNRFQGRYKIEFFRISHKDDTTEANFYVDENGAPSKKVKTLNLKKDRGWVEVGICNFYGDVNNIIIEKGTAGGFLRLSAIRLTLIENEYLDSLSVSSEKAGVIPFTEAFSAEKFEYTAYAGFLSDKIKINTTYTDRLEGIAEIKISSETSEVLENNEVVLADGENIINVSINKIGSEVVTNYTLKVIKQEEEIIDFYMSDRITTDQYWSSSSITSPYGIPGKYCGTVENKAEAVYTPKFAEAGVYDINVYRVIYQTSADKHVKWEIYHNQKTDVVYVDNLTPGENGWENLGAFDFLGDGTEYIKVCRDDLRQGTTRISAVTYKPAEDDSIVISKPSFYENNEPAYDLSGSEEASELTLSYTMANTTQNPESFVLLVGVYNNGVLEKIEFSEEYTVSADGIVKGSVSVNSETAGRTLKGFIWNNKNNIKPLSKGAEINNIIVEQ